MKYLSILLCCCCSTLPAQVAEVVQWQEKWDNSRNYTLELLESIPADSLTYSPTEDQMTLRGQFQHMARNMYMLTSRFLGYVPEGHDQKAVTARLKDENLSKADLATELTQSYAYVSAALAKMSQEDLDKMVDNFFAGPKTQRQIAWLLQDHLTHHRGQVIVYARLLGIKPPGYRGW